MSDAWAGRLISVVGGESTGKSALAVTLGERLPGLVVPEFLRTWVDEHEGRVPLPDEQAEVIAAQRKSEVSALQRAADTGWTWVVSDSGPLMTAVYSIQYYDDAALLPAALDWAAHSDRVVWCQADFPWQPDPQRDGEHARARSQEILAAIFAEHPELPVLSVHGPLAARADAVISAVG